MLRVCSRESTAHPERNVSYNPTQVCGLLPCLTNLTDPALLPQIEEPIRKEIEHIGELSKLASNYPYYK